MLQIGSELTPWVFDRIDEESIRDLAAVLQDPNPIHLDADVVRAMGLGDRVINQGPAGIGYLMNMLRSSVEGAEIEELNVNLAALVHGGDRVTAGGRVDDVEAADNLHRYRCTVWLDVDDGTRSILGTATIVVADS
jgi:3-hydroxybutyryl-CoA dehydratase